MSFLQTKFFTAHFLETNPNFLVWVLLFYAGDHTGAVLVPSQTTLFRIILDSMYLFRIIIN